MLRWMGLLAVIVMLAACQEQDATPTPDLSIPLDIPWQTSDVVITAENANRLKLNGILQGHQSTVFEMVYSHDQTALATVGGDNRVNVWNMAMGEPRFIRTQLPITKAFLLPNNETLLTLDSTTHLMSWRLDNEQMLADIIPHSQTISSATLSNDGSMLALGAINGLVRIVDTARMVVTHEFAAYRGGFPVRALHFSPNDDKLYTIGDTGVVLVWDANGWTSAQTLEEGEMPFASTLSPDGQWLAIARSERVNIYDAATSESVISLAIPPISFIRTLQFSQDKRWLAMGGGSESVTVFDTQTGDLLVALRGHGSGFSGLAFSANADLIVTGLAGGKVYLWNLADIPEDASNEISIPRAELSQVPNLSLSGLLWSADGTYLLLADRRGPVYMLNVPE